MRNSATFPIREIPLFKKKLVHWIGNFSSGIILDSNHYPDSYSSFDVLAGAGEEETIPFTPSKVFTALKEYCGSPHDWLFGYLSYDLKNEAEPGVFGSRSNLHDEVKFPIAHFFRPKHIVEINNETAVVRTTDDPRHVFHEIDTIRISERDSMNQPVKTVHRFPKNKYLQAVEQLRAHIAAGDVYEVNLCQEFFLENFAVNPAELFIRLNETAPAPFACFLKHGHHYLLSSSPERFLKKQGNRLISQPIKGTIRRIEKVSDGIADHLLKEKLRNDPKEQAENIMIVDLMRNDLSRSAIAGTVKVEELFGIRSFPNVHHMVSTITSALSPAIHFTDALKYAFPMGSMTGAPKVMAMQLIDQYEMTRRGLFSGTVGYITPEDDFDFNVVIRSFLYNDASKYLSFQTGSAITFDSIAENEYEECLLKAKGLLDVLEG